MMPFSAHYFCAFTSAKISGIASPVESQYQPSLQFCTGFVVYGKLHMWKQALTISPVPILERFDKQRRQAIDRLQFERLFHSISSQPPSCELLHKPVHLEKVGIVVAGKDQTV
jgi:hypothetical protein